MLKLENFNAGRRQISGHKPGVHLVKTEEGDKKPQVCCLFAFKQSSSNIRHELFFFFFGSYFKFQLKSVEEILLAGQTFTHCTDEQHHWKIML